MNHAMIGYLAFAVPVIALVFALFALGVVTLGKPPVEAPPKASRKPAQRPRPTPPALSEREKRRAERRARRRNL